MQIGIDMSHHNDVEFAGMKLDFIFMKATEGKTYADPAMNNILMKIAYTHDVNNLPIIGFYHFARADGNAPENEAEHFIKTIEPHIGKCHLALDFEATALTYKTMSHRCEWINNFLRYVREKTGNTPFLYMSAAYYKTYEEHITEKHKYWIAHYGVNKPSFIPDEPYIHQYCSNVIDTNIYTGTRAQLSSLT